VIAYRLVDEAGGVRHNADAAGPRGAGALNGGQVDPRADGHDHMLRGDQVLNLSQHLGYRVCVCALVFVSLRVTAYIVTGEI
jgi:hypothetical protein